MKRTAISTAISTLTPNGVEGFKRTLPYASGTILITLLVLYPLLSADFLNWDDQIFIIRNRNITSISATTISNMFCSYIHGNYCPLSILSYSVDYKLGGGLNPGMFHFTSLLLHLVNTLLVFLLAWHLVGNKPLVAALTAALFGIHPMHLESVAWVSERRDVLYTFFYLLGLLSYLRYLSTPYRTRYLLYTFLFFLCSMLSKGQGVTLPLAMLSIDFMTGRKFDRKCITEKIPFFLFSVLFGYIAIMAQRTTPAMNLMKTVLWQRPFIASYELMTYTFKALIPIHLSGYHPYPSNLSTAMGFMVYSSLPVIVISVLLIYKKYKSDNYLIGGLLFFVLTIFPVLQFIPVGETIISERYTYIPYIGLFLAAGRIITKINEHFSSQIINKYIILVAFTWVMILSFITNTRVQIWKNSIAFWSNAINVYPDSEIPYNNRGFMYNETGQLDLAISDFNKGISLAPGYGVLYLNRGYYYSKINEYDLALGDYNKSITLYPAEPQTYLNRGNLYNDVYDNYDLAIQDFRKVLELSPGDRDAIANLGLAFFNSGVYDSAIVYYNQAIAWNPKTYYYINRGFSYSQKKKYAQALADYNTAIAQDSAEPQVYIDRGNIYTDIYNKYDLAIHDFRKAITLFPDIANRDKLEANIAIAFYKKQCYDSAVTYFSKALKLNPSGELRWMRAFAFARKKDYVKALWDAQKAGQMGVPLRADTIKSWEKRVSPKEMF